MNVNLGDVGRAASCVATGRETWRGVTGMGDGQFFGNDLLTDSTHGA